MSKCPECGKFLKDVTAIINGNDDIKKVFGFCKKHGKVNPTDWSYEDFVHNDYDYHRRRRGE
jgi:hypothetical protein